MIEYRFSDATAVLYRFFWSEYCDWYVEASKASLLSGGTGGPPVVRGGPPRTSTGAQHQPESANDMLAQIGRAHV